MDKEKFFQKPIVVALTALFCCALWGSAFPAVKIGCNALSVSGVPSTLLFAGIRFLAAGIFTVASYSMAKKRPLYPKFESIMGIVSVGVFQALQYTLLYIGLSNTTGVKGTVASGTSAFFCVLISCIFFKQETINARKIIACLLGFSGIVIANLEGLELTMSFLGDGLVILSTLSYAVSAAMMKRLSLNEDPVIISGYQFTLGGVFMLTVGFLLGGTLKMTNIGGLLILLYLVLLTAVSYALWAVLLKYNPVSRISVFSFTTPIFGTVFSILLLKDTGVEPINLTITLVLVSLGIFLLNYESKRRPNEKGKYF